MNLESKKSSNQKLMNNDNSNIQRSSTETKIKSKSIRSQLTKGVSKLNTLTKNISHK